MQSKTKRFISIKLDKALPIKKEKAWNNLNLIHLKLVTNCMYDSSLMQVSR